MKTTSETLIRQNEESDRGEAARRTTRTRKMVRQDHVGTAPVEDPMEALALLFTNSLSRGEPEKRLMPFSTLAPPEGIPPKKNPWFPFIEHRGRAKSGRTRSASRSRYYFVAPEVADLLRANGYVEVDVERSARGFVYRISLLGIAVYAGYRKERLESLG